MNTISLLLVLLSGAVHLGDGFNSYTSDTAVDVYNGDEAAAQGANTPGSSSGDRWQRHDVCREWITVELTGQMFSGVVDDPMPACAGEVVAPTEPCPDGSAHLAPWWVSKPSADGSYGPWSSIGGYQCAGDILLAQVEAAWVSMPIAANTYGVQPATGYAIAELGVILAVDTAPRTIDVTLMGTPVTIRAVATQYTWTNTDGTTWTSTDPGKSLEDGGKPFTFPRVAEHRSTFTLTTTWRGEFTTNGGATWRDAPGTATTTSNSTTVHIYNPHTHLVDCDLNGNCVNGSQGGGNQKTILDPDGDGIDNYLIPDDKIDDYLATRDQDRTWTDTARKG